MSEKIDVLKAMQVAEAYCYDAGAANAARNMKEARNVVAELIDAAGYYFAGWCQDEADSPDDGIGPSCGLEQHKAAVRLRDALACVRSS